MHSLLIATSRYMILTDKGRSPGTYPGIPKINKPKNKNNNMENRMKVCKTGDCAHRGIYIIADAVEYCVDCGNKLTVVSGKGICGHDVMLADHFCGECGVNLTQTPDFQELSEEEKDNRFQTLRDNQDSEMETRSNAVQDSGFMGNID